MTTAESPTPARRAFVLGGGGRWGAVELGMLKALVDGDGVPDVVEVTTMTGVDMDGDG